MQFRRYFTFTSAYVFGAFFVTVLAGVPIKPMSQPISEGTHQPLTEWSVNIGDWDLGDYNGILQLYSNRLGFEELSQSLGLVWFQWDPDRRSYTEVFSLDPIDLCGSEFFHSISLSFFSEGSPELVDVVLSVRNLRPDPDAPYGAVELIIVEINKLRREVRPLNCR